MKLEKIRYRVCAPTLRKKVDGSEQVVYPTIGAAFLNVGEENDHSIAVKLESMPLNFSGELALFVDNRKREATAK